MSPKRVALIIVSSLLLAAPAGAQEVTKSLSLQDCIAIAMRNNLGIQAAVMSPELAHASLTWAKEKFLPRLSFGLNRQSTSSASYSWIEAAETVKSQYNDFSTSLSQSIPSGGSVSLSLSTYKSETNRSFQTINPRYGSTLTLSFSQPLLRNFGPTMSRRDIIVAQNNKDISEGQLTSILLDTVFSVEQAYWNLISAIETLKVKQQSLSLARDLLAKNKREAEIGMIAPIEILSAEAEVATREADILQAEIAVANSEDLLRTVINIEAEEGGGSISVVPSDEPSQEAREVSVAQALEIAVANRPDLAVTRIGLKNKELNVTYARNQVLPDLNFYASYWSPGISGTQILYQDNNPLTGIVIGTSPGGAGAALSDALGLRYNNWSVGLQLSIPVSSLTSRAQYEYYKTSFAQSLADLAALEQQIFLEVRTAVRSVETNYRRVLAYQAARDLAENKLQAEEKKLKVGLTTNYVVLQYQRDLADAKTAELRALIDYNLALAYLDRSMGTGLKARNIQFTGGRRDTKTARP